MLALAILVSLGSTARACGEGVHKVVTWQADESMTEEDCLARGSEIREDGYCREVYEVSTEEELRAMSAHPEEAYVLTQDITLTKPWGPMRF